MIINGYDAEKLAKVKTLGDLIPLLNARSSFAVYNHGHGFKIGTVKWLKQLPQEWNVYGLEDNNIYFSIEQKWYEKECGKVLEAKGWRKDEWGFYSVKVGK